MNDRPEYVNYAHRHYVSAVNLLNAVKREDYATEQEYIGEQAFASLYVDHAYLMLTRAYTKYHTQRAKETLDSTD